MIAQGFSVKKQQEIAKMPINNTPVGEATTGIRIATAVQWRQCTIGEQDTSNQGVT